MYLLSQVLQISRLAEKRRYNIESRLFEKENGPYIEHRGGSVSKMDPKLL